jgi:hypothetical protein
MSPIAYNRQINRKAYIWKIFAKDDLIVVSFGVAVTQGLIGDSRLTFAFFGLFFLYLVTLRLGRPPGFDVHWFRALLTPNVMRPGQIQFLGPVNKDLKTS